MSTIGNFSALAMNAVSIWPRTEGTLIHYVYPGTIDVSLGAGIRFQTSGESKDVELGTFIGKGEASAKMWMDDALWRWQSEAAARRAQVWVKHVMVADLLGQPQGYEFEGELVLVGIRVPSRRVELLLLQAGFRPSLATWRAKASDERRRRLPEFVAWLGGDEPEEPRSAVFATSASDIKELKDRAQHVWMRWYALFAKDLATAGRTYQMRGRPTLGDRELVLKYRHPSSGGELALRFDVAAHPVHHKTTAEFDDQTLVREALAWEEYPDFVTAVGDAIKPRSAPRKDASASPRSAAKPAATRTPRSPLPAKTREEARDRIGDLVLPPSRRSAYLTRVEKAADRGENPKRLITEASKESTEFMRERAANRSQEPTWAESVVQAFEQEPGWRLDVAPRGPGHVLTVYPEDGALADGVVSIEVRDNAIGEVRWLPPGLTTALQDELLRRVQRALKAAKAVKLGELPPSPLAGRIEEVRRRVGEFGIDPATLAGQPSHGMMARALAYLADPRPDLPEGLIRWLRATHDDHPALGVIEEWRDGDVPGDTSLAGELWSAVFKEPGTTTVHARDGVLHTSTEAPFTTGDGGQAVLLRRVGRDGEFQLFKMRAVVRPTDDPNVCEIEDDAGHLRDGDQLLLVGDEDRADDQIELYRRIAEFIAEVERTPERLEDVRQLLFLTAAMIDAPRCKGAHRAAATRAFEKAREYYDTARRSLARGAAIAASERVHDALRRIGLAAASIAEACAEGQEPLAARVSSEHAPRLEPSEEDTETLRAVEAAENHQQERQIKADAHAARGGATTTPPAQALRIQHDPIARARAILTRAGVTIDPAGVRAVGRLGECCAPTAAVREQARRALRDAGIHASIVRDRLLFPLVQS
ncbi:MAG: hypothetical protein JNL82_23975 [Myxococcales bacterium]|nr:hypothetical protein [Myxococcales bacterium]